MFLLSKWLIEAVLSYGIVMKIFDVLTILLIIYAVYKTRR